MKFGITDTDIYCYKFQETLQNLTLSKLRANKNGENT
jgi:hypothetical protein